MSELKRLRDYPLGEWMEAADGCGYCGALTKVMVTHVNESGNFGSAQVQYQHEKNCLDQKPGDIVDDIVDVAGWEFSQATLGIAGREFPTLKSRANIGPCLNCWKLIIGVPIILFHGVVEVDFCSSCAKELEILGLKEV